MSFLMITYTDRLKPKNHMAGVVKYGYLKKKQSMRKKFFVLREETINGPSHLEYHDSEKKWKNNELPKRVIVLKSCFNIEKRVYTPLKKQFICLYTEYKYYNIQFDTDLELNEWLELMLKLQRGITKSFDEPLPNSLEHTWHISIANKELGTHEHLIGKNELRLCVQKVNPIQCPSKPKEHKSVDIMLSSIRRCGALGTYFYMEVGQSSPLGPGHIWIETGNNNVASSIHKTLMSASSRNLDPRFRTRSSSFNEESQQINCPPRQHSNSNGTVRERCDSMPVRPRTTSENKTSSTRSSKGILSPNQTFHESCNCVYAAATLSKYSSPYLSGVWDMSLPKSKDTTDGVSSFYASRNDNQSVILEEKHEDFVSYTPLDKIKDSFRCTSGSNVNNYVNLINNNIFGNKSSSSSQAGSCCDSNSVCGSPINVDNTYTPLYPPGAFDAFATPDEYVPMKPACPDGYVPMDRFFNSKQDSTELDADGYVPMKPLSSMSDYVSMDGNHHIESGTPSTDPRFSNIHLDKVCAYISPPESEIHHKLPARANSVGSRPDGLRNNIDKVNANHTRERAFSAGSRGRLPPTGLLQNGYQCSSTNMSEQSDNGDRMEIDFSCNSRARRHYSATCRNKSIQPLANVLPRLSPKPCPSLDTSCAHRPTGCSPPKSVVSSGAVHSIFRSPPTSSHTLERVSEVPSVELVDGYTPINLAQGCEKYENTNMETEDSSKKKNSKDASRTKFPKLKMIGGLNWKKKQKT